MRYIPPVLTGLIAAAVTLQTRSSTFTKTPGGASVSVESEPGKRFTLCLAFRVPSGMPPWQAHLAEHVLIGGKDGTLAARLQTYDVRIQGITTRSQACVIMDGPATEIQAAVLALQEVVGTPEPVDPAKEINVLKEEAALRPFTDLATNGVYATASIGPLYPGDTDTAPSGWLTPLLAQPGAAAAAVVDGDAKPLADSLAKVLAALPKGSTAATTSKLPPSTQTNQAVALRIGPAGTPGFLAGAAFAVALSGRVGGECVVDLNCEPSFAVVTGDRPNAKQIETALVAAPFVAQRLADHWCGDPFTWVQLKAASMLAGLRLKRSELAGLAKDLRPDDYANAAEALRS